METLIAFVLGAILVLVLAWLRGRYFGFPAQVPEDYDTADNSFVLRKHLDGPVVCEGVIYGPTGRVTSRFVGDFDVQWSGSSAVMRERFEYDSGDVQYREWRLNVDADGNIRATADDVVGEARGRQQGSSVLMRYRLRLPEDAGGHVLTAVDWMYITPSGTIVNRSQFRKFGIKVAELVATMRPKDGGRDAT